MPRGKSPRQAAQHQDGSRKVTAALRHIATFRLGSSRQRLTLARGTGPFSRLGRAVFGREGLVNRFARLFGLGLMTPAEFESVRKQVIREMEKEKAQQSFRAINELARAQALLEVHIANDGAAWKSFIGKMVNERVFKVVFITERMQNLLGKRVYTWGFGLYPGNEVRFTPKVNVNSLISTVETRDQNYAFCSEAAHERRARYSKEITYFLGHPFSVTWRLRECPEGGQEQFDINIGGISG